MSQALVKINEKSVQLGEPYKADMTLLVGRDMELRKILAAWMGGNGNGPLAPLLVGNPGVGKNRLVYECARLCGSELYIFQGHEDVTAEDLVCAVRFSDDAGKKMDYIMSPIVSAMIRGGICFIDEIAKIRPRALAPLASLLDERRYLDSNILGERIYSTPGFRFICATNTADLEGTRLPDFIQSRLRPVINVGYPVKDEIDSIVTSNFKTLTCNGGRELLNLFWKLWGERHQDRSPTPRDTIQIFSYALKLAEYETVGDRQPVPINNGTTLGDLTKEHLDQAFEALQDSMARSA
jgi:MoxR-like ATPase